MRGQQTATRAVVPFSVLLSVFLAALVLASPPAQANRKLTSESLLQTAASPIPTPPPSGQIEGACGLAVSSEKLYVADYYHRAVHAFTPGGQYLSQLTSVGTPPEGPCGLALSPAGALYANIWHQRVVRLLPSPATIEEGHSSTGVAVAPTGNIYVNDRTYVAVYQPNGAPVEVGGQPQRIGVGSLQDAYGVAVFGGRVYVPDAGTDTIKVFEPAADPANPVATISHGFVSLQDAAVAVDPTNGHLVVVDNTQPGWERPAAALQEFEASGAYLGKLACAPVDGGPTGLAFDTEGNLFVTNGNGEGSNVFRYGPYTAAAVPSPSCEGVGSGSIAFLAAAAAASEQSTAGGTAAEPKAQASDIVQQGGIRLSFDGALTPERLSRHRPAAVRLSIKVKLSAPDGGNLPQLRGIAIAFNRAGHLDPGGFPTCRIGDIQPSTTAAARAACRRALVGEGSFSADVRLPEQSPFPAHGRVLAFNGRFKGRPAILAHVFGTDPVPTSYTLPFAIGKTGGTYGTVLRASLPAATGDAAAITGLELALGRGFVSSRRGRTYISASCPAAAGFRSAAFSLARATLRFPGRILHSTATDSCKAGG